MRVSFQHTRASLVPVPTDPRSSKRIGPTATNVAATRLDIVDSPAKTGTGGGVVDPPGLRILQHGAKVLVKAVHQELRDLLREIGADGDARRAVHHGLRDFRASVREAVDQAMRQGFDAGTFAGSVGDAYATLVKDVRDALAPDETPATNLAATSAPDTSLAPGADLASNDDVGTVGPPAQGAPPAIDRPADLPGDGGSLSESRDQSPLERGLARLDDAFRKGLTELLKRVVHGLGIPSLARAGSGTITGLFLDRAA